MYIFLEKNRPHPVFSETRVLFAEFGKITGFKRKMNQYLIWKRRRKKLAFSCLFKKKSFPREGWGGRVVLKDIHPGLTFLIFFLRDYNRNDKWPTRVSLKPISSKMCKILPFFQVSIIFGTKIYFIYSIEVWSIIITEFQIVSSTFDQD